MFLSDSIRSDADHVARRFVTSKGIRLLTEVSVSVLSSVFYYSIMYKTGAQSLFGSFTIAPAAAAAVAAAAFIFPDPPDGEPHQNSQHTKNQEVNPFHYINLL